MQSGIKQSLPDVRKSYGELAIGEQINKRLLCHYRIHYSRVFRQVTNILKVKVKKFITYFLLYVT